MCKENAGVTMLVVMVCVPFGSEIGRTVIAFYRHSGRCSCGGSGLLRQHVQTGATWFINAFGCVYLSVMNWEFPKTFNMM